MSMFSQGEGPNRDRRLGKERESAVSIAQQDADCVISGVLYRQIWDSVFVKVSHPSDRRIVAGLDRGARGRGVTLRERRSA